MANISSDSLCWKYLCSESNKIISETNILLKRSHSAKKNIVNFLKSTDMADIQNGIELLADSSYEFNSYHKLCYLMKFVCPTKKIRRVWAKADNLLKIHADTNDYDNEIIKLINNININNLSLHEKNFINILKNKYGKYGFKYSKMNTTLNEDIYNIHEKICFCEENININNKNNKKTEYLFELLTLRKKYAELMGCESYFDLTADVNINEIKLVLTKILDSFSDIDQISVQKSAKLKSNLSLDVSLSIIFSIISSFFKLYFTKNDDIELWYNDVSMYTIMNKNNKLVGYLYIDLKKREGKFNEPNSLILHEACPFPIKSNIIKTPIFVLIGNLENKINYHDVIKIFRQFGNIVHGCYHRSRYGLLNIERSMIYFMEHLMEHIICQKEYIEMFIKNKKNAESVYEIIHKNNMVLLKYKCSVSLFDYMCHSIYLYKIENINDLIKKFNDILKSNFPKEPQVTCISDDIINFLTFNGGYMYTSIFCTLMAHNVFTCIKDTGSNDKFINDVLSDTLLPLKESINKFINSIKKIDTKLNKTNPFIKKNVKSDKIKIIKKKLYVNNLSDISNKNINVNSETNYFTEN
jgi:Zn-dependent oligopeptidase